jgi:WD40 repeat protein/serine/threonine protein kinase
MSADRARRAEEIFFEVMDCPSSERSDLLAARCNGDTALRAEVESLLRCHDKESGLLDAPAVIGGSLGISASAGDPDLLTPGTRLGEYTIERTLGEGGMGVVYIARQERPSRTVALKVIRRGLASGSLVRRFEHEAEVLGRLQHPGIAQIYEAGSGAIPGEQPARIHPFIAMELIKGPRLTDYAASLSTRDKLALLAKVCAAVHHAHQRGIIHRDLKPANILVDDSGQPKILDFGVARAADSDLRVTTMQTSVGQLVGTLPYMSPEQVLADPSEVDTRSDVYALGVILYQLLTGKLPLDLSSRSIPEAARVIRDENPAPLSSVSRVFRGDVDTIVSKAIEKDKNRRYQSAAELGADIERHLRGEPIAAKADSPLYVLKKQLRRYRLAVGAGVLLIGLLTAFGAYAWSQARREHALKLKSDQAAARLADELSSSTIERGRLLGLTGNTTVAEHLLWSQLLDHPDSRGAKWALWEFYSNNPVIQTLPEETYARVAACFSPDGTLLALARTDKTVSIYTADLAKEVAHTDAGRTDISCLQFSPDSTRLAIGTSGGSLRIVDAHDGRSLLDLPPHRQAATSLAFSPDSSLLACGMSEGLARVFETASGIQVYQFQGPSEKVTAACFSADRRRIAFGYMRGTLQLVDAASLEPSKPITTEGITTMTFTHDGKTLLVGRGNNLDLLDPTTGERTRRLNPASEDIRNLSLSTDGTRLFCVGGHGADVWDTATWNRRVLVDGDPVPMMGAINPKGDTAIINNIHGKVQLWELRPQPAVTEWGKGDGWITCSALSPDGATLATSVSGKRGYLMVWDVATGQGRPIPGTSGWYHPVCYDHDGTRLAAATIQGDIDVWDSRTLTSQVHISTGSQVNTLCFTLDGSALMAGPEARAPITQWSLSEPGASFQYKGITGPLRFLAPRPGHNEVASAGGTPSIMIWNPDTHEPRQSFTGEPLTWHAAFTRDGRLLSTQVRARNIEIRDADTFEVKATLMGHVDQVLCTAFSPDAALLASCSVDGCVKLWDVATGRSLANLFTVKSQLSTITFTQDGRRLIFAGQDGVVRCIDMDHFDRHIAGNMAYVQLWYRKFESRSWANGQLQSAGISPAAPAPLAGPLEPAR